MRCCVAILLIFKQSATKYGRATIVANRICCVVRLERSGEKRNEARVQRGEAYIFTLI